MSLPRHSLWFLTVNSNKTLPHSADRRRFDQVIDSTLDDLFYFLRTRNPDDRAPNSDLPDPGLVLGIEVQSANEVGTRFRRYHLHAVLRIKHKTKLYLDYAAMADYISGELGYVVSLRGTGQRDGQRELEEYLNKNQITAAPVRHVAIPGR